MHVEDSISTSLHILENKELIIIEEARYTQS